MVAEWIEPEEPQRRLTYAEKLATATACYDDLLLNARGYVSRSRGKFEHVYQDNVRQVPVSDAAYELVQATYEKCLPKLEAYDGDIRLWLLLSLKRLYWDHCQRKRHTEEAYDAYHDPRAEAASVHLSPMIEEALRELPESWRQAVILVYVLGYEQTEAAAILGVDRRTIRRWLDEATAALRLALADLWELLK